MYNRAVVMDFESAFDKVPLISIIFQCMKLSNTDKLYLKFIFNFRKGKTNNGISKSNCSELCTLKKKKEEENTGFTLFNIIERLIIY